MRPTMLLLLVLGATLVAGQPALASCAPETALDLARRGDIAATGVVDGFVPLGFIFAADRAYKGDIPAHVLVLGQYRPPDLLGIPLFVAMRFHLPGVYSMDICDGRTLENPYLGLAGEARVPTPDLPIGQAAIVVVVAVLALLLRARRGRASRTRAESGQPPAPR